MIFILSEGFPIPYRNLARAGFKLTTSCLPYTHTELSGETMRFT